MSQAMQGAQIISPAISGLMVASLPIRHLSAPNPRASILRSMGDGSRFILQTLLQHETPQEMLGRVIRSLMSLMAVSQVLAMVVAGPVAQFSGIRNLYFASAVMLFGICTAGVLWLRKPRAAAAAA